MRTLEDRLADLERKARSVEWTFKQIEEVCDRFTKDETGTVYDLAYSIYRVLPLEGKL